MKQKKKLKAFTLAEVLIALGIIGIVAAMTIPSLMQNISNKQLTTATNNFNRRFGEALKIMNSQGILAGRKTTQGFLDELSKVFKVAKVCDNTKLDQCFPKNITWGEKEVDTTTLKKSFNIVDDNHDWGTDVMGVRFANGVSGLIAYNPDCKQDSGNTNLIQVGGNEGSVGFSTNNCLAMLYDVSSNKKPNKVGTDIQQTSNVENLGGIIANINGVKLMKVASVYSVDLVNCQDLTSEDKEFCYGSTVYKDDNWSRAAKACGGKENLPTFDDAYNIAKYLYKNDIKNVSIYEEDNKNITIDNAKKNELMKLGFPDVEFAIWTELYSGDFANDFANIWIFNKNYTGSAGNGRNNHHAITVLCVKH